ncbi:MAG: permease prefix domain 1-containing protein [Oscillospiraceae bacterium]|nr:permease prefix domain 1-containing protein [Oscillospiraceae bacterium]
MNDRLRSYIDEVFSEAPYSPATIEMKEEFLQNLTDKYTDLVNDGKSEDAAYNIAVASVGDVSQLVMELQGLRGQQEIRYEQHKQISKNRQIITAIAIALYILCPVPNIVFSGRLGVALMFVFIAVATALLIYNGTNRPGKVKEYDTVVDEFQEWRGQNDENKRIYKSITSAVWSLGLVAYFLVSFLTGAWHLTWLIFLIIGAINGIIKAVIDLQVRR